MTIIKPNKNKIVFNLPCVALSSILIFMAAFSVFLYNQNVNLRHSVSAGLERLQTLQEQNADFKNKNYTFLDSKNTSELAKQFNLVQDDKPEYLEGSNAQLASGVGQ